MFTDVSDRVLPKFVHETGRVDTFFYPEIMGAGAAVFDFDNDGNLDIYFINGRRHTPPDVEEVEGPARNRLLRGSADGVYTDVTEGSGLGDTGYGMGVAVGDIDNDGDADVYVTNFGPDALYRNNGDGTFTDITASSTIANNAWGASACFADFDADGSLDLFVTNYLDYGGESEVDVPHCKDNRGDPDYCGPQSFDGTPDRLYHNNGDGTFADASTESGIGRAGRKGLGLLCIDFTGDRRPDVLVANDGEQNQLWVNKGDSTFVDEAPARGLAVNAAGRTEAGMGVAAGDANGDGQLDVFMTHIWKESNTLYAGGEHSTFEDRTDSAGLAALSRPLTGFGTAMFDIEHDGDLDIVVVNGRVFRDEPHPDVTLEPFWSFYAEPNLVFENDGQGQFSSIPRDRAGPFVSTIEVGRALIPADLDGDGDLDLVLTNCGGRPRVYRNDAPKDGHWLAVRAIDPAIGRDVIGATITVSLGDRSLTQHITRAHSYLSAAPPAAHFGLGNTTHIDHVTVLWPDGTQDQLPTPPVDHKLAILKGTGGIHE